VKKNRLINIKASGILYGFSIISVLAAYVFGLLGEERNFQEKLFQAFPEMSIISTQGNDPICYFADFPEGKKYVLLYKTMGWGGPAMVATKIDTSGKVEDVRVVDHKETPAFFTSLLKNEYFIQFIDKNISDRFSLDEDINAVSGATISSQGFNKAIGESCHYLANAEFQMEFPKEKAHISFSFPGYLILLLFAIAYFGSRFGLAKFRILLQMASIVIIGFMLNFPLSMSHITSLFMGFFPSSLSDFHN
jgi:Na+-translocating ferredoxin:NAD+ oxidoreductase RnfG subunit